MARILSRMGARRAMVHGLVATVLSALFLFSFAGAEEAKKETTLLIRGARVFAGTGKTCSAPTDVLVRGNKIVEIAGGIEAPAEATIIEANGRTLMPGMIDAHWHSVLATTPLPTLLNADMNYLTLMGAQNNRDALLRGFTTVRDTGGNVFAIKRATDEGRLAGPRIYPSGGLIGQTSGHGDFRAPNEVPSDATRTPSYWERVGMTFVADGVPEVMRRCRENLRLGATQLKVMGGGGVASDFDPLDVTQYTLAEMRAAVEVAETWNTYVTVHAFTVDSVRQSIKAGVKCIEHGHLLDEDTLRLMADKGVWLSMQPVLNDEDAIPFPKGSPNQKKFEEVTQGTARVYRLAKKLGVRTAWGTDTLFDAKLARKQGKLVWKMGRWYEPHEVLKMVTHDNAELLKMCGPRDPYPGRLGVIEKGALADMLLIDGNPLENLELVADPANIVLIVKDGKVYKDETAEK